MFDKKNLAYILTSLEAIEKIFIYTDGSCIKFDNGIFKAGYGIYIPSKNIKISEAIPKNKAWYIPLDAPITVPIYDAKVNKGPGKA